MTNQSEGMGVMNEDDVVEQTCRRCRGLGEDSVGADCVPCDGFGSLLVAASRSRS